jgi:transcriptional antiterminator RfaH
MGYWSVAQTQPFAERKAKRFLEGQNFPCYLPQILQTGYARSTKRTRIAALFPRYLFVQIESAWHRINTTPGIAGLLIDGGSKPLWVRDRVIGELQARENKDGLIILPEKEKFKKGQRVKVISGQFAGQLALYDGMSSRARERVLLQILGRHVPVELNIDSRIEAASLN